MLTLTSISASYGHIRAISNINLQVGEGEFVAVLGPNGAGKTTLMKVIAGVHAADRGTVAFAGAPITDASVTARINLGISAIPEGRQLFPTMSVRENLIMGSYPSLGLVPGSDVREKLERVFELFPRLRERQSQTAGSLSGGEAQMVAIGRALMSKPRLLLCDEPSLGLAPKIVREMLSILVTLREQGTTILLADQNAHSALRLADRGYVIDSGQIVMEGPSEALLADQRLHAAYLGTTPQAAEMQSLNP